MMLALSALGLTVAAGCGSDDDCARLGICEPIAEVGAGGDGTTSAGGEGGSGQGGEGGSGQGGGEGGAGGSGTPCTPGATPANGGCVEDGIFVRASGSDASDGSKTTPVATLNHAAVLAGASGKVIYACAEIFAEKVELPPGVTLYGGLDCDDGWTWQPAVKTTVAPTTGGSVPLVLLGDNSATTVVEDVAFVAPDATEPGQSSIAAQARQAKATLRRCLFQAGMGAAGAAGSDASSTPPPAAPAGNNGAPGYCSDTMNTAPAGGAAVGNNVCFSIGGKGGNGAQAPNTTGTGGWNGSPTGSGTGLGGPAQPTSGTWSCPNITGAKGDDGAHGAGAPAVGFVTPDGDFSGSSGEPGKPGLAGVGGGGGGGRLSISCPGYFFATGPGGGSGGAGGCGGAAGGGGGYGGSSIAIVSIDSELALDDSEVIAGVAGHGGDGGAGQPGATGGAGGLAGTSSNAIFLSCLSAGKGGKGGDGGAGGPGGGGSGGNSVAIMHVGAAPTLTGATLQTGTAGAGGNGGPGGDPGSQGAAGTVAPLLQMMLL